MSSSIGDGFNGATFQPAQGDPALFTNFGALSLGNKEQWFADSIHSLFGSLKVDDTYVQDASEPMLTVPSETGEELTFGTRMTSSPEQGDGAKPPSADDQFMQLFTQEASRLVNADMESLAGEMGGLTQEQLEEKIKFAFKMPNATVDPKIREIANRAAEYAEASVEEQMDLPSSWEPTVDSDAFLQQMAQSKSSTFSQLLAKENLSQQDQGAIEYAYHNPEATSSLTPRQRALLTSLSQKTDAQIADNYGAPTGFKVPLSSTSYNFSLSTSYSESYLTLLQNSYYKGEISSTDYSLLKSMHFYPEGEYAANPELSAFAENLAAQATAAFIAENGLPSNFTPTVETMSYDNYTNGIWRDTFEKNLQERQPPLSEEQKVQVRQALADPASATGEITAIVTELEGATTKEVKTLLGLPSSWAVTEKVISANANPEQIAMLRNTISTIQELLNTGLEAAEGLPKNDPSKQILLDYFKIVGEALNLFQELLYMIESKNSALAKEESKILLEAQMNKIEKMRKEIAQKYKKQKGGLFGKIMRLFMSIILAAFTMGIGILVGGFSTVSSIISLAGGDDYFSQAIEKAISEISKLAGGNKALQALLKTAFVIAFVAILGGSAPGIVFDKVQDLFGEIMQDILSAMGASDKLASLVTMAITVAITIAITVATFILTAGASSTAVMKGVLDAMRNVARTLMKAVSELAKSIKDLGTTMQRVQSLASDMLKEASSIIRSAGQKLQKAVKAASEGRTSLQITANSGNRMHSMSSQISQKMIEFKDLTGTLGRLTRNTFEKALKQVDEAQSLFKQAMDKADEASDLIDRGLRQMERAARELKNGADDVKVWQKMIDEGEEMVDTGRKLAIEAEKTSAQAENLMRQAHQSVVNVESNLTKSFQNIAQKAGAVAEFGQSVLTVTEQSIQASLYFDMAQHALKIGRIKADIMEIDALIKVLKKIIDELLESLGPLKEAIGNINAQQKKKYDDASTIPA